MGLFKKRKKPRCLFVDMNDENLKSQGFMADKKGAVAVIFAVTLVPIVGLTGAAIDYSRAQQSRAVLQAAADAAALAGSRALMETASETNITTVQTAVRDRIDRFVQANIEGRTYSSTALNGVYLDNWEIKNNRRSLYVRLGSNVPMLFGSFLGASTRTVMAEAEVTYGQGRAEIAIAVGSSYSMLNHMTALRQAVDDFVDIVFDGQASQAETLVSIIPFTAAVNIGNDTTIHTGSPNLAAMMDVNGLAPRHGVTFENKLILGGCYVPPPPPPPPPTCPPGFVWDEWMYSCVCSNPSFVINYNPTPETCIPDPCTAPAVWDGYSCSPPPPPPPPPATCSPTCGSNMNCVSPNTCSCINHYVPNPSGPGCIPGPCPPPASGTWGNCTCPPGMSWTGSTCSPPPPPPTPCPPPATGTLPYCDCPSPDYWDGYQCSPPPPPPPPPNCSPCSGVYPDCYPPPCPPGFSVQGDCPFTACVPNPGGGSGCGPNNPCPPGALLDVDDLIHTAQSPAWGTVVSQIGGHLSQWLQNFGFSPAIAQSGSPLNAGATSWPYGTFPYNAGMLGYYGLIMDPASNANVVQLVAPTSRLDPGVCGYRLPSQVNYFDLFRSIGVTWGGCVEARPYPHNVQDTVPTSGTPATLFVPYFAPDEPEQVHKSPFTVNDAGAYWEQGMYFARYAYTLSNPTSNPSGGSYVLSTRYVDKTWDYTDSSYPNLAMTNNYIRAYQRYINTNYDDDYYWNTSTYAFSNERMKFTPTNMQYFIWKYNFAGYSGSSMLNQQTYSGRSFTTGPNAGCPVSILPPSGVKADITAKMNAMKAEFNAGTNVVEGLAWAWRSISPNLPFAGRAYGTDNPKFLILMTDGQNDLATLRNNLMRSTYTAHGYANDFVANGTWTSEPSTTVTTPVQGFNWNNEKTPLNTAFRSTLDANFTELCTNIKTTNTKIFIILYSPTGEMAEPRTPATTAMFQSCSSGNGYFYEAFSQDDLIAAFQGIGGQIRQLRIVR